MDSVVCIQSKFPIEGFPALLTFKGSLARVDPQVPHQVGFSTKRLRALGALVRPIPGVRLLMPL